MTDENLHTVINSHRTLHRHPVLIFLSDGECGFSEAILRSLCHKALTLGSVHKSSIFLATNVSDHAFSTALSFHSIGFGSNNAQLHLMSDLAVTIQNSITEDPVHATVPSSHTDAISTVSLI